MGKLIKGIDHYCLRYKTKEEYKDVIHFYCDVLGLKLIRTWGEEDRPSMWLDTGNGLVEVFNDAEETLPQGAIRHIAFRVIDPDACVKAVRDAGYTVKDDAYDLTIPSETPLPLRVAFVIGPLGEEIEFFSIK